MRTPVLVALMLVGALAAQAQQYGDSKFKQLFNKADAYIFEGSYKEAYPLAEELFLADSMNANVAYMFGIATLYGKKDYPRAIQILEQATRDVSLKYQEANNKERKAPGITYMHLGRAYHFVSEFERAIANYYTYRSYLDVDDLATYNKVRMLIKHAENAMELTKNPIDVRITNLGPTINTQWPEYAPVLSADGQIMIFTSRRPGGTSDAKDKDGSFFDDIYVSILQANGSWGRAQSIGSTINTTGHEAAIGLSPDGQTLFIYKDDKGVGNIYVSQRTQSEWGTPVKLGGDISTPAWETHATVSAAGDMLIFTSNRAGSYGGRDLWYALRLPDGNWAKAQNLGSVINTPFEEESPYLALDGKTLFFSSQGHTSMGGFDIFRSEFVDGVWTEPENLGYPINTPEDDVFFVLTADGRHGYFSSRREGGFGETDIYVLRIEAAKADAMAVARGEVVLPNRDFSGRKLSIVVKDESGEQVGEYRPNPNTGYYVLILDPGETFTVTYKAEGYDPIVRSIPVPAGAIYAELGSAFDLKPVIFEGVELPAMAEDQEEEPAEEAVADASPATTSDAAIDEEAAEKARQEAAQRIREEAEKAARAAREREQLEAQLNAQREAEEQERKEQERQEALAAQEAERLAAIERQQREQERTAAAEMASLKAAEAKQLADQQRLKQEQEAAASAAAQEANKAAQQPTTPMTEEERRKEELRARIAELKRKKEEMASGQTPTAPDTKAADEAAEAEAARKQAEDRARQEAIAKQQEDARQAAARAAEQERAEAEQLRKEQEEAERTAAQAAEAQRKAEVEMQRQPEPAQEEEVADDLAPQQPDAEVKALEERQRAEQERAQAEAMLKEQEAAEERERQARLDQEAAEEAKRKEEAEAELERADRARYEAQQRAEQERKQQEAEQAAAEAEKKQREEQQRLASEEAARKAEEAARRAEEARIAAEREAAAKRAEQERMAKQAEEQRAEAERLRKETEAKALAERQAKEAELARQRKEQEERKAQAASEEERKASAKTASIDDLKAMKANNTRLMDENIQLRVQLAEMNAKLDLLISMMQAQQAKAEPRPQFNKEDFESSFGDETMEVLRSGKHLILQNILFDYNKARLRGSSEKELDKLRDFLMENKDLKIKVSGHTDAIGDAEYNMRLSRARAQVVMDYLIAKGVPSKRLKAEGFGQTRPIAKNMNSDGSDNPVGRQLNRRIEISIFEGDSGSIQTLQIDIPEDARIK